MIMSFFEKLKQHSGFFIIVILTIVFALPYMEGISPFDAGNYCKCAINLLRGEPLISNFYCNRLGTYLPVAMAIKLFGFNGFYLTWVTLFELVILLTVIYAAIHHYNKEMALITCSLTGFAPVMLVQSGTLNGDIMAALTSNLCILWIWHIRFGEDGQRQALAGIVLSLMWYFALLTKETAVYYLFPILLFFILDRRQKQFSRFWNAAFISGILIGVAVLLVYIFKTGNVLHRLQLLESGPNSPVNYAAFSWQVLLARLTVLPVKFLIEHFSFYVVFLPGIIQFFARSENDKERFFKVYAISLLFLWWAGTQSLSTWKPMILLDRLWLPLLVPLALNAAHVYYSVAIGNLNKYATRNTKIILAAFAVAVTISAVAGDNKLWDVQNPLESVLFRLALPLFLFISIFYPRSVSYVIEAASGIIRYLSDLLQKFSGYIFNELKYRYVVVLILLLPVIVHWRYSKWKDPADNNYLSEQAMFNKVRSGQQPASIVCEPSVAKNHGIYYGFDLEVEQKINFVDWNTVAVPQLNVLVKQQPVYLLLSKDRLLWYQYLTVEAKLFTPLVDSIPGYILDTQPNWELIEEDDRAALYKFKNSI